jgi:6-pyruvoyltetrahydropterin/6-carboxytetrahydropterin synthase
MAYQSTKTYGHDIGLSCAFRQWRAQSHCHLIHGYALSFRLVFEADELDITNWVVDFGGLKPLKAKLQENFDHTMLVAKDDPKKDVLLSLQEHGLAKIVLVDATGCEATAKLVFDMTNQWLVETDYSQRVKLVSVEVAEHGANSAVFKA